MKPPLKDLIAGNEFIYGLEAVTTRGLLQVAIALSNIKIIYLDRHCFIKLLL